MDWNRLWNRTNGTGVYGQMRRTDGISIQNSPNDQEVTLRSWSTLVKEAPCAGFALGLPNAWGMNMQSGETHSTAPIRDFQVQLRKEVARTALCTWSMKPTRAQRPFRHPLQAA